MVLLKDNLMNSEVLFTYDVNIHLYYDALQEKEESQNQEWMWNMLPRIDTRNVLV
jgi:hypothetical protein